MLDFLPRKIKIALNHINLKCVYELRLRAEKPIMLNYLGEYRYLSEKGITHLAQNAMICNAEDVAECLFLAGESSVYAMEEQIKKGFITGKNGERIGIAGEYIFERGQPLTIRNFSSICIRLPHEVLGCGVTIYDKCMSDKVHNILIISPPGLGKTTILRDLARITSEKRKLNILICDERGEISAGNIGKTCDVLKFCDKNTAFEAGIRALRPDIIITDELSNEDDMAVRRAVEAGVYVIASAHYRSYNELSKNYKNLFDYYITLDLFTVGKVTAIHNKQGEEVFLSG